MFGRQRVALKLPRFSFSSSFVRFGSDVEFELAHQDEAELIAARSGVGYMIMSAANFLATDVVFVGLIVAMPLIGHATWHAYRETVQAAEQPADGQPA